MRVSLASCFAIAWAILATSGCSTLKKPVEKGSRWSWNPMRWFDEEYQTPESLAVIWAPEVLNVPGKPATRGFGGRIYFYNAKSQAIPVDGELVVHGYRTTDEKKSAESWRVEADKTFVFTAEQLTTHFSPSQLGASYSIWIPWDAVGGYREQITLIPTFKSADGKIVQGAPARVFLPGKAREGDDEVPAAAPKVHYRHATIPSYDIEPSAAKLEAEKGGGMQTTTITVPADSSLLRGSHASVPASNQSNGDAATNTKRPSWELTAPVASPSPRTSVPVAAHGSAFQGGLAPSAHPSEASDGAHRRTSTHVQSGGSASQRPQAQQERTTFELVPWTERRVPSGLISGQ